MLIHPMGERLLLYILLKNIVNQRLSVSDSTY